MTDDKNRLSGRDATYAALDALKYPPVKLEAPGDEVVITESPPGPNIAQIDQLPFDEGSALTTKNDRGPPPRLLKPSPKHARYLVPTNDLEGHRARLREAFGNTVSDEFVKVMLGKLAEALQPNPNDELHEQTFNAALATLHSMRCRSEAQAMLGVEIIATSWAASRFLRQSQKHMTEEYIRIYGGFALKLLRVQLELMQGFDRMQRGSTTMVGIEHVEIHSGAQVVGVVNQAGKGP
jgi:hypothetical protein